MTHRLPTPEIQAPIRPRPWPTYPAMLVAMAATLRELPRDEVQLYARACWDAGRALEVEDWRRDTKAALAASELSIHAGLLISAIRTYADAANMPILMAKCMLALGGDRTAIDAITRAVADLERSKP